ncbi:uncharacterized protein G6M90_00g082690 [Metarhizium brunneum]|uniref:Oxidoreductase, short chain dehydrogenase/reductase family n=1 Tax=Metarhizium brunneum TaxID=500148 RepID=A0A7D5ZA65_9HYPO
MASAFVLILATGSPDVDTKIALKFAPQYPLAFICDTKDDLKQTVKAVQDAGGEMLLFEADLSTNDYLPESIASVTKSFGKRCAAAIFQLRTRLRLSLPFLEQSTSHIRETAVSPIAGAYAFAQQAVPLLFNHADRAGYPPTLIFSGSSGTSNSDRIADNALVALSRSLGREFGKKGIHVSHVKFNKSRETSLGTDQRTEDTKATSVSCSQ